jgi:uncharacterized phage-associated protein
MRFRFNDKKTVQAAAYVLDLAGGRMNYMTLIKLLYLADRRMILDHGLPITGDTMISMKYGPVLSRVLDFLSHGQGDLQSDWFEYVDAPSDYDVSLKKKAPYDELSRFELNLLQETYEKYGKMDRWKLVDLLHTILPEWNNPDDSAILIDPADILRAESRSEEEIRQAQKDAEELWLLDSMA